jgi:hypothetical protein
MILDAQNLFSDAQALSTTGGASTNLIDLSSDRNIGIGEPMCVVITVDVAADDGDADETYTAKIQTDTVENFASPTDISEAITIVRGTVAGTRFYIPIAPDARMERYVRVYYTLGGTSPTVTLTSALIPQKLAQNEGYFPSGYTVTTS